MTQYRALRRPDRCGLRRLTLLQRRALCAATQCGRPDYTRGRLVSGISG